MGYLKEEIIDEIKERSDIVQIISEYVTLKSMGSNFKANCPFHSEKTPSFVVSQVKQMYKCFGCGEGGDVINFIMKIENVDFSEALKILADKAGVRLEDYSDETQKAAANEKQRLIQINTEAAKYFFNMLWNKNPSMLNYFARRGLDRKTIKGFGLGYSGDSWNGLMDYLKSRGYSQKDIIASGLVTQRKKGDGYRDRFINRVIFPIFDHKGLVIGFGGRVIDDSMPKYLNSPETLVFNKRYNLYGLNFAKKVLKSHKEPIIVVEGYMDVIALHQFGVKNSVASLGTALTQQQALLLKRFTDEVIISYDNDSAGIKATLRGMDILNENGLSVRILNLKDAKDPDDYIRKNGVNEFRSEIENAVSFTQFKIDVLRRGSHMDSPEGKAIFCKEVAKILKNIESPVEAEYHIKKISDETGISVEAIGKEAYGKYFSRKQFGKAKPVLPEKIDPVKNGIEIAQKKLIFIAVKSETFRQEMTHRLSGDEFDGELKVIFEKLKNNLDIEKDETEFLLEEKFEDIEAEEFEKLIIRIKKNSLRRRSEKLNDIQKSLQAQLEENYDTDVEKKLLEIGIEIFNIENELRKY
ncbi:DNA primase [Peptoclostridium litorale DSM 5388]|uniref:DNA primase n=1 Tax=Peptoclostridium litorale DSM 5388 TaxID=1121324 RepID=A0A069RDL3_PEPLI|nr:DNA primase [Peptoclostridium litorale]KDR95144.1 DNA primase DnaG [Peptoclostridium litorale DSM 5388]SIN74296.1 DNA primase [Peptoclostridium litorale DSM 5388]